MNSGRLTTRAPTLFTLRETVQALRIARAAREYVRRSEELVESLVKSETLDPKIELRTGEAWGRLLEAVKAPKTWPPPKKKRRAQDRRAGFLTAADSITIAAAGQTRERSCFVETALARYARREHRK
jgi:hypothetical protein